MQKATYSIAFGIMLLAVATASTLIVIGRDGPEQAPAAVSVPSAGDPSAVTREVIAFFEQRTQRDGADFVSYAKVGEAYIRLARETGDGAAYLDAEAALVRALELRPDDLGALSALATVRMATHDFAGALEIAERVYAADPGATQALATIGDAQLALGNYEAAAEAYDTLVAAADGPAVLGRLSHLAYLTGDTGEAIALMAEAEATASKTNRSAERIAWYRIQLGELHFGRGDYDEAGRWYASALEAVPRHYRALAGFGHVAAARGDYGEAVRLFEQSLEQVLEPPVHAALGDVYARLGDGAAAQHHYDIARYIGAIEVQTTVGHQRELALFYANHDIEHDAAVELALQDLELRGDVHSYDAAAWALYRAGRADEAAPLMAEALRLGTEDAGMFFHAGLIARELGDFEEARRYLGRALELNPAFSLPGAQEARSALEAVRSR